MSDTSRQGLFCPLEKNDLITLVLGTNPSYEEMNRPHVNMCGCYVGGHRDVWVWDENVLERLNLLQLWSLYKELKKINYETNIWNFRNIVCSTLHITCYEYY